MLISSIRNTKPQDMYETVRRRQTSIIEFTVSQTKHSKSEPIIHKQDIGNGTLFGFIIGSDYYAIAPPEQ